MVFMFVLFLYKMAQWLEMHASLGIFWKTNLCIRLILFLADVLSCFIQVGYISFVSLHKWVRTCHCANALSMLSVHQFPDLLGLTLECLLVFSVSVLSEKLGHHFQFVALIQPFSSASASAEGWACRAAFDILEEECNILSSITLALNCTGVLDIVSTLCRMRYSDQGGKMSHKYTWKICIYCLNYCLSGCLPGARNRREARFDTNAAKKLTSPHWLRQRTERGVT